MNIGQAAEASGVSAKMIRYYEEIGLVPKAQRADSGYRHYADADVHTLRFIRRARDLGFSVEQITQLLALWRDRSRASGEVKTMALGHVAELQRKIAELQAMARTLSDLAKHCGGDQRPDCPILDDLAADERSDRASLAAPDHRFGPGTLRSAKADTKRSPASTARGRGAHLPLNSGT